MITMVLKEKGKHILEELKGHAPFTCIGALLGIAFMVVFRNIGDGGGRVLFSIFHPAHVILSAIVTASMFKVHTVQKKLFLVLAVGYFGSIGIATLSDIIIPHFGSRFLGLNVPTHSRLHNVEEPGEHEEEGHEDEASSVGIHLGFIEEWYIINPAALFGIFIAFYLKRTKLPHAAHVLISTWASSSYLLMTIASEMSVGAALGIFGTLVIATWIPCCISDIVFPLLFVKSDIELEGACTLHDRHSHPHIHKPLETGEAPD